MRRIGHKGADLIAPGNTFASFEAALAAGVDMIEFDVLPEHPDGTGELLLAHDYRDARSRTPHTLDEGLEHFRGEAYGAIELDVDLKLGGYEERVVAALQRHDVATRALLSTMERSSLRLLRARHPEVRLGWSVPRLRRDPFRSARTAVPAYVGLQALRLALPGMARRAIGGGEVDALMANHHLVTPRLADAVRAAGGELYAWTVDDAERIAWLERLGVSGVITNDPRLFGPRDALPGVT
ncbi:MAG TPA: glycerophosphodiester phosphodiesterase [Solirubrobacteraceae bacterium]|nr:glycerophosphodiester phosphodiesterase [Solirubrobacteraceae bacterium]